MKEKVCGTCKQKLSEDQFSANKTKKDGLSYKCKSCQRKYSKEHYRLNTEYYKNKKDQRRKQKIPLLKKIIEEYKSKPCSDCGKVFPSCAMDFHHIIIKEDNLWVSWLVQSCCSEEKLLEEIKKCVVLCACCHRIRHQN